MPAAGLGSAAGSERTGLAHFVVPPGQLMNPPHVHSAEEEIFVVLDGSGTLLALPEPALRVGRSSRSTRSARGARSPGPPARQRAHAITRGSRGL